jgi:hypothetical protein
MHGGRRAGAWTAAALLVYGAYHGLAPAHPWRPFMRDGTREGVAWLRERSQAGDWIYIHQSMREQAWFYMRRDGAPAGTIRAGANSTEPQDFSGLPERWHGYLAYSDDPLYWRTQAANDLERVRAELGRRGCRTGGYRRWEGLVVWEAECGGGSD